MEKINPEKKPDKEDLDKVGPDKDGLGKKIEEEIISETKLSPEQIEVLKQKIKEIENILGESPIYKLLDPNECLNIIKELIEKHYPRYKEGNKKET